MIYDILKIIKDDVRPKIWAWLIVSLFLLTISRCSHAALTDIKFGRYQIADSQWNVSACLYTSTCQIYSKNPGVMYKIPWTSGQWSWQPGQYVQFSLTGNATNPYEGKVYNSNGTLAGTIGTGHIVNMGPDYFFFVGSDNNTGQLFSGSTGMNSTAGVSWTGTLNPTIAQADAYANATYSTEPLAAGTTATTTPSSGGGGGVTYTSEITTEQTNLINSAKNRLSVMLYGNKIDIEAKIGTSNPVVSIEQSGNYNLVQGIAGGRAMIDGDNNTINIKQGSVSGRNLVEFGVYGNLNTLTVWQARNNSTGAIKADESGGHYAAVELHGDSNNATVKQNNDAGTASGHFAFLNVTGNNNVITIAQANDNEKKVFAVVATGNTNSMTINQQGTGNHYLDISVTGNGHNANITQKDAGTHKATISLTNSGGASNLTLLQQGSTGQTYSISQQCANSSGCGVTVTQGNP